MPFENAYQQDIPAVLRQLETDLNTGLTEAEAARRLEKYGPNTVPPPESTPFWKLVIKQFEDLMVLILLGAALVSFGLALFDDSEDRMTAFVEPAVILVILICNATVGVVQETNAEASIEALKKSEASEAAVIRDGKQRTVHAADLVPGDVVVLDVGDKVPADCRLLRFETATVQVDESILTGESVPAQKTIQAIAKPDIVNAEKRNMIFAGTLFVRGKALATVCQTGVSTAFGAIAEGLKGGDDEKTPLQEKLDEFGEQLSKYIAVICVVVWVINIGHFTDPEHGSIVRGAIYYFKIAVALAVAAIPEGLPAVVTTCLALGTVRMAKKNAIVRSLPSVETLGCTTVICSDKTGTLTTNRMSVTEVLAVESVDSKAGTAQFREYAVEGDSFAPFGEVTDARTKRRLERPASADRSLAQIGLISCLCNESDLQYTQESDGTGSWGKQGSATDAAVKVLAEKLGVPDDRACEQIFRSKDPHVRVSAANKYWRERYERKMLLEFTRTRKSMSVIVTELETKEEILLCKGAPESVIARCTHIRDAAGKTHKLTDAVVDEINRNYTRLAEQGLRCVALAERRAPQYTRESIQDLDHYDRIESGMAFVGLVSMMDPPRKEVPDSIARCHQAGIRVIVITGDYQTTAESICRRIGIFGKDDRVRDMSFTGAEFAAMSEKERDAAVRSARLFSRVEPIHKQQIVEVLKKQGEVTAMTGDGVNDAPALKAASIGIAMGSGTAVAREASDMVLQDDNFATIVMAVEEGRAIYANTKQFIRYLISSNIGEVVCIFMTAAIGMPEALIPVQLLWVNLVTDGLPATALGFNKADKDIMQKPPRDRTEGIINGWMFFRYVVIGVYVGVGTVIGYIWWFLYYENGPQISFQQLTSFHSCASARGAEGSVFPADFDCGMFHNPLPSTMSLSILVTIEMFNALNALSENQSLLVVPPWSNGWVLVACALSFFLHFVILYVPFFNGVFHVGPLNWIEWRAVIMFSLPVFAVDELLKFISRNVAERSRRSSTKKRQ